MQCALVHFEKGVLIDDLQLRGDQKRRLARVDHVYWLWLRNPVGLNYKALFRQLVKGKFSDPASETRAAQRDILLFDYIKDTISPMSRNEAKMMVEWAAKKTMQIGAETDNYMALAKGGQLLKDVAGLDKPEDNRADMSKVTFLPSVVVTDIKDVSDTKDGYSDEEVRRIAEKYGAYIDEKRTLIEDKVKTMEARSGQSATEAKPGEGETKEDGDEQSGN